MKVNQWRLVAGVLAPVLLFSPLACSGEGLFAPPPPPVVTGSTQPSPAPESTTSAASSSPSAPGSVGKAAEQGVVTRVVDGDTLDVDTGGAEPLRVRVLGIDTQEVYGGEECWGAEASAFAKQRLLDREVTLRTDPSQGDTDRYDRALRYVIVTAERANYSLMAVQTGNAYYYEEYPVELSPRLIVAEDRARVEKLGLWGPPCYGLTEAP